MIYLYSGTPGSGKSLHVARTLMNKLQAKKPCVGNFEIDINKIKSRRKGEYLYLDNMSMTPKELINYAYSYYEKNNKPIREGSILLIIDECQLLFNSRDWSRSGRNEWLSFFSQHRKYGYDIILVAQFDRMIDRQIRSLIEYEFVHRKVANFGKVGMLMSIVALGKLFVCVKVWYPLKEKVGSEFFIAHKKHWQIYDTFKTFEG